MYKKIQSYQPLIIFISGLLTLSGMFFTVLITDDSELMNGIMAIFGGQIGSIGNFAEATINFSFLNLMAFTFPAIFSLLLLVISVRNIHTSLLKLTMGFVVTTVFVLSAILIIQLPQNTTATFSVFSIESTGTYGGAGLGIGAIISLISSIFGGITTLVFSILQLSK